MLYMLKMKVQNIIWFSTLVDYFLPPARMFQAPGSAAPSPSWWFPHPSVSEDGWWAKVWAKCSSEPEHARVCGHLPRHDEGEDCSTSHQQQGLQLCLQWPFPAAVWGGTGGGEEHCQEGGAQVWRVMEADDELITNSSSELLQHQEDPDELCVACTIVLHSWEIFRTAHSCWTCSKSVAGRSFFLISASVTLPMFGTLHTYWNMYIHDFRLTWVSQEQRGLLTFGTMIALPTLELWSFQIWMEWRAVTWSFSRVTKR